MSERAGPERTDGPGRMAAVVYPGPWRTIAACLQVVSTTSLFVVLVALVMPGSTPVNPLRLIRFVMALCILPWLASRLVRWTCAGTLRVDAGALVLAQRHRRVEIPVERIAALEPWRLPLPGSGFGVRLRSGRRWSDGIELEDPSALVQTLADGGGVTGVWDTAHHPAVVYAHARSRSRRRPWYRPLLDFPVFALVPTLPLFRVHQIIAYGGALGEYYQYGPTAYLAGFAIYWATLTIYLMVYAAALRVPVEALAVGAAVLAPGWALGVRRVLEWAFTVLYYAGVPAAVALRFVPW